MVEGLAVEASDGPTLPGMRSIAGPQVCDGGRDPALFAGVDERTIGRRDIGG